MTSKNEGSMPARQEAGVSADGIDGSEAAATACAARAEANRLLGGGLGIGALGAVSGALLGAVCPLCIVAAPALVGAGIYKHIGASRRLKRARGAASGQEHLRARMTRGPTGAR